MKSLFQTLKKILEWLISGPSIEEEDQQLSSGVIWTIPDDAETAVLFMSLPHGIGLQNALDRVQLDVATGELRLWNSQSDAEIVIRSRSYTYNGLQFFPLDAIGESSN